MQTHFTEQMQLLQAGILANLDKVLMLFLAFIMPIQGILITVGLSIFADTVIGLWKAAKLKQTITSRKLSQIISKMLLYEATVILFYAIDFYMLNDLMLLVFTTPILLTKVVALTLVSVEVYSMDENFKLVKGKGLFDAFKSLVARAKDIKDETDKLK
jgi:hypothetical protein